MRLSRPVMVALAAALSGAAAAEVQYFASYQIIINGFNVPVTNIMIGETRVNGGSSLTWAFTASGNGTTTITNPFPSAQPFEESFLVGIIKGLPGDGNPNQKHAVLMMHPQAAQLSNHIAWGTLFRNTLEDQLIANIELATSGQDWSIVMPGVQAVSEFMHGDAKTGILGPGGVPRSAWFSTGSDFKVMAFSSGQEIGHGISMVTAVPEPGTMAVLGLGALASLRRRRR